MKLTELSIKNHVTTFIIFILILVAGYKSYQGMEKAQDPGFSVKTAAITTYWPGATAEQMRSLVSDKIAEVLQEMPELDYTESKNRDGISTVYFNALAKYRGDDLIPVWNKLRKKVYIEAMPKLPQGIQGPYVNDEYGDIYGTLVAVTGDGYTNEQLYRQAYILRRKLLKNVDQIGKINVSGVQDQNIYIDYDNSKLSAMGISISDIQKALSSRNVILPGGEIRKGSTRMYIKPSGNFNSVEEIGNTVISSATTDQVVYLKDVASISKENVYPATYITEYNGKEAIMLSIYLKKGEDNIKLGKNVTKLLKKYEKTAPLGISYGIASFEPELVHAKTVSFVSNLIQAIISVLIVMFLALGVRTGLIISSLVPTTIATTLVVLPFLGQSLNQMTLAGLIIALGMLVDNAIVMCETIMISLQNGKGRLESCMEAASSLKIPLLISSLTTMASFLPLPLVHETMGEYVGPLSIVVIVTLFASWVISMTLVPTLSHRFLKVEVKPENFETKTYEAYRNTLVGILKKPKMAVIGIVGMFVLGIFLLSLTEKKFMPDSNNPTMFSEIRFPIGTSIEKTKSAIDDLNKFIEENYQVDGKVKPTKFLDLIISGGTTKHYYDDGIIYWSSYIGGGAPKYTLSYNPEPRESEYAFVLYKVTDFKKIPEYTKAINAYLKKKFPDIEVVSKIEGTGGSSIKEVAYRLYSDNLEGLKDIANQTETKLRTLPGLDSVSNDWNDPIKQIEVTIDQERVKKAGLTSDEVSESLNSIFSGLSVTTFKNLKGDPENKLIPIVLRSNDDYRDNLNILKTSEIYSTKTNKTVPLSQIADINIVYEPGYVHTRDRFYDIEISAHVIDGMTSKRIDGTMIPWIKENMKKWGDDYSWELGGENESSDKNVKDLSKRMPIGGFLIVLLLIAQFNSMRKAFVILLTIPLGVLGVAIGLLLLKVKFGFMPLIGVMSLSGMVVNAAIVLIDSIEVNEKNGMTTAQAIVESCQRRFRPIMLTTATTIFGLVSLLIAGGPLFQPVAVALIFGLIVATILTLGVIPVLYSLFFKVSFKDYKYKPLNEQK